MIADRYLVSALGADIAADVESLLDGEASIALTIAGVPTRGIVREYMSQVEDPRKPEIYVRTSVLPTNQHGDAVVIGAETFTLTGVQPAGPGLVRLVLT